jgi:hypothetical protein
LQFWPWECHVAWLMTWKNGSKWQNSYMCINNHKIMYFIFLFWYDIFNDYLIQESQQICSINNFNVQVQPFFFFSFHNWISPFEITYYEQIFMLTCLLNHNLMQTMWFWVLFNLSTHHCFWLSYMFHGFRAGPIIWQFKKCFNALFPKFLWHPGWHA